MGAIKVVLQSSGLTTATLHHCTSKNVLPLYQLFQDSDLLVKPTHKPSHKQSPEISSSYQLIKLRKRNISIFTAALHTKFVWFAKCPTKATNVLNHNRGNEVPTLKAVHPPSSGFSFYISGGVRNLKRISLVVDIYSPV